MGHVCSWDPSKQNDMDSLERVQRRVGPTKTRSECESDYPRHTLTRLDVCKVIKGEVAIDKLLTTKPGTRTRRSQLPAHPCQQVY